MKYVVLMAYFIYVVPVTTKILKSDIPAQSVWNKLCCIFLLHGDLANLNRLEKAIISRVILF